MGLLLYPEESYIIRGVAFDVYKAFRNRHKETVYQNALALGLRHSNLTVDLEKHLPVYYAGRRVGTYVPDLVVNEKILVELKAKPIVLKEDLKQFWEYPKASEYRLGLLINFGASDGVQIIRRVYDKARHHRMSSASRSASPSA